MFGDYHKFSCFVILSLLQKGDPTGCKAQATAKKSKEFKIRFIYGYFACAQYDKFRQKPKFDSLPRFYFVKSCNDGYFYTPKALFHSNFRDKIYKIHIILSNFRAKIQIFHSNFKAFYKFNSFYNFISNFKPYTRLFHIFTPSFRSVFTDKFTTKEFL